MSNFNSAIAANETAMNSAGSAARENSRYMESLEAKTSALKASFQELANSIVDNKVVGLFLDIGKALLDVANTPIGKFVLIAGALSALTVAVTGLWNAMKLAPAFAAIFTKGTASTAAGLITLNPWVFGLITGLTLLIALAPQIIDFFDSITNPIEHYTIKLEDANVQLDANKTKLEELSAVKWYDRTEEINDEIAKLKEENEQLQSNIDLYNKKIYDAAKKEISKAKPSDKTGYAAYETASGYMLATADTAEELLEKLNKIYNKSFTSLAEFQKAGLGMIDEAYEFSAQSADEYYKEQINRFGQLMTAQREGNITEEQQAELNALSIELQDFSKNAALAAKSTDGLSDMENVNWTRTKNLLGTYEDVVAEAKDLDDKMARVSGSMEITDQKTIDLINSSDALKAATFELNGKLYLEEAQLFSLAQAGDKAAQQLVKNEKEKTEITIQQVKKRIKAYKTEDAALLRKQLSDPSLTAQERENLARNYETNVRAQEVYYDTLLDRLDTLKTQISSWTTPVTPKDKDKEKEVDPIKEQSDAFKELNAATEHNIYLRQKQGASEQELIQLNKEYQNQLHEQAEWFRANGAADSEYVRDLESAWWALNDTIVTLEETITKNQQEAFDKRLQLSQDYIDERNEQGDWGADNEINAWKRVQAWMDEWYSKGLIDYNYYLEKRLEATKKQAEAEKAEWEKVRQEQIEGLEKQTSDLEKAFSVVAKQAQKEIDALENQKTAIEDYYQARIDALQETNDELDRQIEREEALDNLAKARQAKVMVYKDGHYQYIEDVDQVSEAKATLDKLDREETLRRELANLEKLRDEEIASIDKQIEYWEKYTKGFGDLVSDYEDSENKLLAEQILGTKLEGENWEKRLKSLSDYVAQYKALMEELAGIQAMQYGEIISGSGSGSGGLGNWYGDTALNKYGGASVSDIDKQMAANSAAWASASESEKKRLEQENSQLAYDRDRLTGGSSSFDSTTGKWTHSSGSSSSSSSGSKGVIGKNPATSGRASGTLSDEGGIHLLGENGPELGILSRGDGVIPANITKNLWAWGATTPASFSQKFASQAQAKPNAMEVIIQNLNLPGVNDGNSFVEYMKNNFWRSAIQQSTV